MPHSSKNQDRWGVPDWVLGDTHFGMGNHGQRLAENAQLMAYATAAGVDHISFIGYVGGDLMHGAVHEDSGGGIVHLGDLKLADIDYGPIEARVLAEAFLSKAVKQMDDEPPKIKPTREHKKRDWEQRNRKQRR